DELRQRFVDATVPQARYLGLVIPDPELRFVPPPADAPEGAQGHWQYGAIDWAEFKQVLAGNGPCNRERLAARNKAHR
ncbi:hypothetical protein NL480_30130, partial [Klebsiella pneumoniae]|nr:hypothetical protein [Klebsiella pneumoniae]